MFDSLHSWYRRYFTDPQAALLVVLLVISILTFWFMGKTLGPVFAAVIIAYLLEGPVKQLEHRYPIPRILAVSIVFLLFISFLGFLLLGLFPILSRQMSKFFQEVPYMIANGQELMMRLPERYPGFISEEAIGGVINAIKDGISSLGQNILSVSVSSIPALITVLVYVILVPLMIFFFMKDKRILLNWMSRFLPTDRSLVDQIWEEMDAQIGNYIRGKAYEIIIVGVSAYLIFRLLGLNYSSLLAIMVGLSVLIPYIGAAVATLPIALVGYFQWGLGPDFIWLMSWYFVLQFLDGNILVPILFSETVNLHPVAIITAILVFGGLWGFWGVFFAIPLATLVKAIINVWPTYEETDPPDAEME